MRWALRLTGDAAARCRVMCVVRDHEGRWLAGRARPVGGELGGRAGRSAPAAPSTRARTPRSRSRASSRRNGRSNPKPGRRGLAGDPHGHDDAGRPGVARARARGHARPRARRARVVAARPGGVAGGSTSATPASATLLLEKASMSFRTLKYLSFAHSAIYTALLILAITGAAEGPKYVLGLGARRRLDRDVAAVHRRRPPARDPTLARRDGRGRGWRWPVRGQPWLRVCRAACKCAAAVPPKRYGLGP